MNKKHLFFTLILAFAKIQNSFAMDNATNTSAPNSQQTKNQLLLKASAVGEFQKVKDLIDAGADVDAKNFAGWTSLHLAAANKNLKDVAKLLLENEANVNAKNDGWTPLHIATRSGQLDIAKLLLENGADFDAKAIDGLTPLHTAILYEQLDIAKLLLENGADVNAKLIRKNGNDVIDVLTPLDLAAQKGYSEICQLCLKNHADILLETKVLTVLKRKLAQIKLSTIKSNLTPSTTTSTITVKANSGKTADILAKEYGYPTLYQSLLEIKNLAKDKKLMPEKDQKLKPDDSMDRKDKDSDDNAEITDKDKDEKPNNNKK
jgi:ankyrin repeat protein